MLRFDPADPFPLISGEVVDLKYAEAKRHSIAVDEWLGLEIRHTEKKVLEGAQTRDSHPSETWVGLSPQVLQTPYAEIRQILHHLNPHPGETIVDLGAAYGRMGFVVARHYPGVHFVGYEVVDSRIRQAKSSAEEVLAPKQREFFEMKQTDLGSPNFSPAPAEYYFIYDYGTRRDIRKTVQDLRKRAAQKPISVVGRGRASRDIIERENPWLSQIVEPEHHDHYSIYHSAENAPGCRAILRPESF